MISKFTFIIFILLTSHYSFAINIQSYNFSNSLTYQGIESSWSDDPVTKKEYPYLFTAAYSYFDKPLVLENATRSQQLDIIVNASHILHLGFGAQFFKGFLSLNTSFVYQEDLKKSLVDSASSVLGYSDLDIHWKKQVFKNKKENTAASLIPSISIPTGQSEYYLSNESMGYGLLLTLERRWQKIHLAGNLGFKYAKQDNFFNLSHSQSIETSLGAYIPLRHRYGINFEYQRLWTNNSDGDYNPTEFHISAQKNFKSLTGFLSFGSGDFTKVKDNVNGNTFRILAGIKYLPTFKRKQSLPTKSLKKPSADDKRPKQISTCKQNNKKSLFVHFDFNSYELNQKELQKIHKFALGINKSSITSILVKGHTDEFGQNEYNMALSEKRARNIKKWLIDFEDVSILFYGKQAPLFKNASSISQHRKNRRVEIIFLLNAHSCTPTSSKLHKIY